MKITMKTKNFEIDFEESDSWEETKDRCLGTLQEILVKENRLNPYKDLQEHLYGE